MQLGVLCSAFRHEQMGANSKYVHLSTITQTAALLVGALFLESFGVWLIKLLYAKLWGFGINGDLNVCLEQLN